MLWQSAKVTFSKVSNGIVITLAVLSILLGTSQGRSTIRIKELSVPSLVALHDVASLSCQYDFGDELPYQARLYKGQRELYRYNFFEKNADGTGLEFRQPGIKIIASHVSGTELTASLQILSLEATGLYSCEITSDKTFMTTSSSREMQAVTEKFEPPSPSPSPTPSPTPSPSPSPTPKPQEIVKTVTIKAAPATAPTYSSVVQKPSVQSTLPVQKFQEHRWPPTASSPTPAAVQRVQMLVTHKPKVLENNNDKNPKPTSKSTATAGAAKSGTGTGTASGSGTKLQEFFYKNKSQLNLNILNVLVPFFQSVQRNMTTLINLNEKNLTNYRVAHDLINESMVSMEVNILRNRRNIVQFSEAYDKAEKELSVLSQTLQESTSFLARI